MSRNKRPQEFTWEQGREAEPFSGRENNTNRTETVEGPEVQWWYESGLRHSRAPLPTAHRQKRLQQSQTE